MGGYDYSLIYQILVIWLDFSILSRKKKRIFSKIFYELTDVHIFIIFCWPLITTYNMASQMYQLTRNIMFIIMYRHFMQVYPAPIVDAIFFSKDFRNLHVDYLTNYTVFHH